MPEQTADRVEEPPRGRIEEIEVLRALAVCGVILHHSYGNLLTQHHHSTDWLLRHVDFWTGVDLFFAISGFVIARVLLPAIVRCRTLGDFWRAAGAFWIRRAFRLLPSAWLWLALILLASAAFNSQLLFSSVQANAYATLAGVLDYANFRFAHTFMRTPYGASFAWWSLSLEEQFYILMPPVAYLFGRALPFLLLAGVAAQFPVLRGLLLMVLRTDAIMLGVLLATWERHPSWRRAGALLRKVPAPVLRGACLGLLFLLGAFGTQAWEPSRYRIGLIALASAALVFLAGQDRGLLLPAGRLRRALGWIGARSYALYLIHIPAMFAVREAAARLGYTGTEWLLAALFTVLLFGLADLNFRWVETPGRRLGARLARRVGVTRCD